MNARPALADFQAPPPSGARRALRAAAFALLACTAAPLAAQRIDSETVTFETREASGATLLLRGTWWNPAAAPKGVVVLVHGSGGLHDHPVGHYGRALSAAGYAALAFDSFTPRNIDDTVDDQSRMSALQMARDAFAALQFIVARGHAAERVAVMGFSKGGTAALYAADRNFLPGEAQRFRAALSFYPGCVVHPRVPKPVGALYLALAELDDYAGTRPCVELAESNTRAGGTVTVRTYPGAAHAFDGPPEQTAQAYLPRAENYSACRVVLDEDGHYDYRGTRYAPGDRGLVTALRRTCMKRGAAVWTHPGQKAAATRDAIEFLDRTLAR